MKVKTNQLMALVMILGALLSWYMTFSTQAKNQKTYAETLLKIEKLESKKLYADALEEYKTVLSLSPRNYELQLKYADALFQFGNYNGFINACKRASSIDPTQEKPYVLQIEYFLEQNSYKPAFDALEQGLVNTESAKLLGLQNKIKSMYKNLHLRYTYIGPPKNGYRVVISSKDDRYGILQEDGKSVIPCEYDFIGAYSAQEKVFPVLLNQEYYYIDIDNNRKLVGDHLYEFLGSFSQGYAPAAYNGKWGYINRDFGEFVFEYDKTSSFIFDVAAVCRNGKWGLINTSFEEIIEPKYEEILLDDNGFCTANGKIWAKDQQGWILLDQKGNPVSENRYQEVKAFASEQPAAVRKNGLWGFVALDGSETIRFQFEEADSFSLGYGVVMQNGIWNFINLKGEIEIEILADGAKPFGPKGTAPVANGKHWSMIQLQQYS